MFESTHQDYPNSLPPSHLIILKLVVQAHSQKVKNMVKNMKERFVD
jgi:hypothetical protein